MAYDYLMNGNNISIKINQELVTDVHLDRRRGDDMDCVINKIQSRTDVALSKFKKRIRSSIKEIVNKRIAVNNKKIRHMIDVVCKKNLDSGSYFFSSVKKEIKIKFLKSAIVKVIMVGGGGAGGIGFDRFGYYICGSGGDAGCYQTFVCKPCAGNVWKIVIGKGGIAKPAIEPTSTYLTIDDKSEYAASAGANGLPTISQVKQCMSATSIDEVDFAGLLKRRLNVDVANGINCCGSTGNGQPGSISGPSAKCQPGCGGFHLYTGLYGRAADKCNLVGYNGSYGSGGGGSYCRDLNGEEQLSGNGGNGYILIKVLNEIGVGDFIQVL